MGIQKGNRQALPTRKATPPAAAAKTKPGKDYVLSIRFDPEERAQLEALERDMHLPLSVVIRQLILAEYRRRALA